MNALLPNRRRRPALAVLAAILALLAVGPVTAAPAAAKKDKNCGKAVINDWFGDYRVNKIFPRHCYRDAIKALPVDVRDYSSAREDILRALAYARQGKPDPGDPGSSGSGGGAGGPGSQGGGGTAVGAEPGVDTSGPSSVPIPLLVLGGLATLLLALGAAGYLTRRMAARRADEGDGEPPAEE